MLLSMWLYIVAIGNPKRHVC